MGSFFLKIWSFYYDGFRSMQLGKTLWAIIIIKLLIMFLVLKVFFFPNLLSGKSQQEKANFVSTELINRI
ncbi:MAG: DUF4492 domain-containing protein [Mucinivorans sp.]